MSNNEDLKKWLESRFQKIDTRLNELEKSISENKQTKIRIAWYRTLIGMTDLGGKTGTEQLADHLGISRSAKARFGAASAHRVSPASAAIFRTRS
jgi:hypothetical protein